MSGFIDEAQLHVKAGNGGAGIVSFRREAHVSRGGPDGGDGGHGGDVVLVATSNVRSLLAFHDHPHRRAGHGTHGQGKNKTGAGGASVDVPVPIGTTVRTLEGLLVADLARSGDRFRAARGGRGGRGNARFLSNSRRAPSFAEQGEVGEEAWFDLELKLLADVALVGFPNAGKSTLLAAVSAARPKIADYPFTTLEPNLGVVRLGHGGDSTEFVMADIPGLVEGAASGRGLGHRFLRHVERARVLLVLLDLAETSASGLTPERQLEVLFKELGAYRPSLLARPRVVAGSRADLADAQARRAASPLTDLVVSAVTTEGLADLLGRLGSLVAAPDEGAVTPPLSSADDEFDEDAQAVIADAVAHLGVTEVTVSDQRREDVVVHRPTGEDIEVRRADDGAFFVSGRRATRAVALSDLTDPQAEAEVQRRLKRIGVERLLVRAGVREGDIVHVGELSFTYHADDVMVSDTESQRRRSARDRRRPAE